MIDGMRTLRIKVKPNARSSEILPGDDGVWLVRLKAPPVDGKANEELIRLVAEHFGVRRVDVTLRSGAASRLKLIQIPD
jgi:uncharacterized protein